MSRPRDGSEALAGRSGGISARLWAVESPTISEGCGWGGRAFVGWIAAVAWGDVVAIRLAVREAVDQEAEEVA
ncbi:MAG: hypothetical protein OXH99_10055 [Bryobacterales bacterium]|nr:hypothetical protein [Bryobacterales bacterium]